MDFIERSEGPFVSFELIPPKRGGTLARLLDLIGELAKHNPPFIDVTSHASLLTYKETAQGIKKRVKRKRPGTLGVCALIQHKFGIEAVPHLLCKGFTRDETEDFLLDLRYLGIQNVFAIQGDSPNYEKKIDTSVRSVNEHAFDLVSQINDMNNGHYLDSEFYFSEEPMEASDFCIGVAGYPERHYESPNITKDIQWTKAKIDAGAGYIVTQLFLSNYHYINYVQKCRQAGIQAPIIPGIKVLTKKSHLKLVPRFFHAEVPFELSQEIEEADPSEVLDIGVRWAVKQVEELLDFGVPGLHIYVTDDIVAVKRLMEELGRKTDLQIWGEGSKPLQRSY